MILKILVIGEVGTGKTCLVNRYIRNEFIQQTKSTIACDLHVKPLKIKDEIFHIQLWDIGGADRLGGLSKMYVRHSHGAVVVADISNDHSLDAAKYWKEQISNQISLDDGAPLPVFLLVNKSDLRKQEAQESVLSTHGSSAEYLQTFITDHYFQGWHWVSAKTGQNVEVAFLELIQQILAHDLNLSMKSPAVQKDSVLSYHGMGLSLDNSPISRRKSKCC